MYRIKTLNKISTAGLDLLDQTRFQVGSDVENEPRFFEICGCKTYRTSSGLQN